MRALPALAAQLCEFHEGWVLGSAADGSKDLSSVRDFDIMIPFKYWPSAALLIPKDAKPNTFGGWKCVSEEKTVDVWPGDLAEMMTHSMTRFAWHPKSGKRITCS